MTATLVTPDLTHPSSPPLAAPPSHRRPRTIDDVLDDARARLVRLDPHQAHEALAQGALLIDIRPAAQRAAEGSVPGALVIERNVLEWRFDPTSAHRVPEATGPDLQIMILCSEGYTSSLAAAALVDLGLRRATDVVGGFRAWHAAGLPTTRGLTWPSSPTPASHLASPAPRAARAAESSPSTSTLGGQDNRRWWAQLDAMAGIIADPDPRTDRRPD
jgi:rhodanese-related sulfurtransferase